MTSLLEEYGETAADVYYQPVQEELILPIQLPSSRQPAWTRFMLSLLLEEAVADATAHVPDRKGTYYNTARKERNEALAWINSNERSTFYPTFRDTCDHLGLEPEPIRKAITKPGFKLATEWTFDTSHGLRHEKIGDVDFLQKMDRKAQRRKRRT